MAALLAIGFSTTALMGTASADYSYAINQYGAAIACGLNLLDAGYFSVGNCHTYAVNRRVVYTNGDWSGCRTYEPQRGFTFPPDVKGRTPSYIQAC